MEELLIALDSYDDIFSDFDIRDYKERAISVDLLHELRRRLRQTPYPSKLVFTVPKHRRVKRDERKVVKRLKAFFRQRAERIRREISDRRRQGITYFLIGFIIYLGLLWVEMHITVLEPLYDFALFPSWYLAWLGFDKLLSTFSKDNYYERLAALPIEFENEEDYED